MLHRRLTLGTVVIALAAAPACQEGTVDPDVMLAPQLTVVANPPFTAINIDSTEPAEGTGDCEVEPFFERDEGTNVNVAINRNWINASCHMQLTADELAQLGGPFSSAQVYRDFDCAVGNDHDPFDDVPATSSHATITPSGQMSITCRAPVPS